MQAVRRALASVAASGLMLALPGCNIQPSSEAVAEPAPDAAAQEQAALAAAARETHRACITTALNNTIYKQQTDLELEDALLSQNLGQCPDDFIQAYVNLRAAARNYFAVGRELRSHLNHKSVNGGVKVVHWAEQNQAT